MDPRAALRRHFDFEDFRPGQAEAVQAALTGRDVLVVMPTGAGKSLTYQLPALMRDDLCVVVSPLVALMKDQVDGLAAKAPGAAALINAQQDQPANRAALERALAGDLRLLYIAPERFSAPGFAERLREARVGLFVVDEAHCVSQWGHDFRPDYFRLGEAARYVGAQSLVASTATATPQVAADIVRRLGLRSPARVTTGFDRPNLSFAIVPCRTAADKGRRLVAALRDPGARPAIVYAGTRDASEQLAKGLRIALGAEVVVYHAGLEREARAEAQRRFMSGEAEVVVATNAFGMGIDKADVRTVAHASVPPSLEAYYQEAGRAGRDGRPASALLFAANRDKGLHVFFIERARRDDATFTPEAERARWREYRSVWAFVEGGRCRREAILRHFGDHSEPAASGPCCDVCDPSLQPPPLAPASAKRTPAARRNGNRAAGHGNGSGGGPGRVVNGELDSAILDLVVSARPSVGRTRAVEILRGGRSKVVLEHSYDGLPGYGTFAHLTKDEVLGRVDELLSAGTLQSTGGRFPKIIRA
jgi:ATP-dependent DNA helicase RecQ